MRLSLIFSAISVGVLSLLLAMWLYDKEARKHHLLITYMAVHLLKSIVLVVTNAHQDFRYFCANNAAAYGWQDTGSPCFISGAILQFLSFLGLIIWAQISFNIFIMLVYKMPSKWYAKVQYLWIFGISIAQSIAAVSLKIFGYEGSGPICGIVRHRVVFIIQYIAIESIVTLMIFFIMAYIGAAYCNLRRGIADNTRKISVCGNQIELKGYSSSQDVIRKARMLGIPFLFLVAGWLMETYINVKLEYVVNEQRLINSIADWITCVFTTYYTTFDNNTWIEKCGEYPHPRFQPSLMIWSIVTGAGSGLVLSPIFLHRFVRRWCSKWGRRHNSNGQFSSQFVNQRAGGNLTTTMRNVSDENMSMSVGPNRADSFRSSKSQSFFKPFTWKSICFCYCCGHDPDPAKRACHPAMDTSMPAAANSTGEMEFVPLSPKQDNDDGSISKENQSRQSAMSEAVDVEEKCDAMTGVESAAGNESTSTRVRFAPANEIVNVQQETLASAPAGSIGSGGAEVSVEPNSVDGSVIDQSNYTLEREENEASDRDRDRDSHSIAEEGRLVEMSPARSDTLQDTLQEHSPTFGFTYACTAEEEEALMNLGIG
jgi:hypothetical protein